jgi:RHS repeat-associated protein
VDNVSAAALLDVDAKAVLNNGSNPDLIASKTGHLIVPQTPESFSYDADGNLIGDGRWTYAWDAENRLLSMESKPEMPESTRKRLDFAYDYQGRRIQKIVSEWNGSSYVPQSTNKFLYDGWNLIAVLDSESSVLQSFVWGLDLSGSMQGAGGVGGLVAVNDSGATHFIAYDGNGNVTRLMKASDSTVSATYEYSPFGEPLRVEGVAAKPNPFRFSTKYTDDETDLVYYGYRYYNANAGRWLNKDLIHEKGGINIYGFVANNPISRWDILGKFFEGGEWPFPPNKVDPPSGPFSQCKIAVQCGSAKASGIPVGTHCGIVIDVGDGSLYALNGSGGNSNRRDLTTPPDSDDPIGPYQNLNPSVCACLFSNIKSWNDRHVPRKNECENSNWNLKCALKKCSINIDWGGQNPPTGYNCSRCLQWSHPSSPIGVPVGSSGGCCVKYGEVPCPDE